jgi:hypothetical protein
MDIPIEPFLQNIEALGCVPLDPPISMDGDTIKVYLSRNGKSRVFINTTDETMSREEAEDFLWDLELGDMVDAVLPRIRNN